MTRRGIPYGVINWAEVVRECHFVDNTGYIRALERCKTPIFLRPKRFGKSLVCSMLEHYYDVGRSGDFEELFGNTDIGRNPTPNHNAYLVIVFDFSTITVGTLAEIERNFFDTVKRAVDGLTTRYGTMADWSRAREASTPSGMIDAVRQVIADSHLPPLYVIVDEYDNFTNELVVSNRDDEYNAICGHDNVGISPRETYFKAFFKSFKAGLRDGTVAHTYFTGVLPITLDDLSSGFNVGTMVSLNPELLGLVGFTEAQVRKYVEDIYDDYGFDRTNLERVLEDLKAFYDGYHFLPDSAPLYNPTICNWYLFNLVAYCGVQPEQVMDDNIRTDIGWIRRLAGGKTLERIRGCIERGEGEAATRNGLVAKFGRAKFFTEEFFPYALYYLGLMTFSDAFTMNIPNLTIRSLFVDYYDELSEFSNEDEARKHFVGACRMLCLEDGSWKDVFEQYWQYYVKARIPAQAFDKMNENFFRTTFASRVLDAMPMYYSTEIEYNTSAGRADFLAIPKRGFEKPAMLVEFKYFTGADADKKQIVGRAEPDKDTVEQALRYCKTLRLRPGWHCPIEVAVVEVCGNRSYNWFEVKS